MGADKKQFPLHWVVLLSVVVNLFFNLLCSVGEINGQTAGEIYLQQFSFFTPADFTFNIWSLIYFACIIYAIVQVFSSQSEKLIYRELALPFIAVNVLSVALLLLIRAMKPSRLPDNYYN